MGLAKQPVYESYCKECSREINTKNKQLRRLGYIKELGGRCVCCGIDNPKFLTFDHINTDGADEKRKFNSNSVMNLIPKRGLTGLQILCFNCNCGRFYNQGTCPHAEKGV